MNHNPFVHQNIKPIKSTQGSNHTPTNSLNTKQHQGKSGITFFFTSQTRTSPDKMYRRGTRTKFWIRNLLNSQITESGKESNQRKKKNTTKQILG